MSEEKAQFILKKCLDVPGLAGPLASALGDGPHINASFLNG